MRRPPAGRRSAGRRPGPGPASPRSAPACPGAGKRSEPGAAPGRGAGAPAARSPATQVELAGRRRPPRRPAGPSVPPPGDFGRGGLVPEGRKGVPGGPARPGGARRGGRRPEPPERGWVEAAPGAGCGMPAWRAFPEIWRGGRRSLHPPSRGCDPPPTGPGRPRVAERRPLSARSGRRGPLLSGVGGTSSVDSETRRP